MLRQRLRAAVAAIPIGIAALLFASSADAQCGSAYIVAPPTGTVVTAPGTFNIDVAVEASVMDPDLGECTFGGTVTGIWLYQNGVQTSHQATQSGGNFRFSLSGVPAGTYSYYVIAAFRGNPFYLQGSAASQTISVRSNGLPAISLTAPANGAVINGPSGAIYMSATASDDAGINRVEFYANGSLIHTDTAAPYEYNWSGVGAGTYSISARAVDSDGAATTSVAAAARVNAPPSVNLTAPSNGTTGQAPASFTLSANASDADGSITQVEFLVNGAVVNTDTAAPYSYTWSNVGTGSYTITARATDNNGQQTTSAAVTVTVNNVAPTVALTAPANGTVLSGPTNSVAMSANASDANGSINRVEFYAGTTLLFTDTAAPYEYTWANIGAGTYSITAKAFDNEGAVTTSSAASVRINALPTVSLTSPANGATVQAPASFTLSANASDADGSIAQVEFLVNGAVVNTDTAAPYTYNWTGVGQGTYSIAARATDNNGQQVTTGAVTVTATSPNTAQFVSQSVPTTMTIGQSYPVTVQFRNTGTSTWTAAANYNLGAQNPPDNTNWGMARIATPGSVAPTATATFSFNVTPPSTPGNHNFQWRMVQDGVEWFGDASTNVVIRANPAPSVSLTQPANGATFVAPAAVSIAATATDDTSVQRVEILVNGTVRQTVTAPPYAWTMQNTGPGSHTIVARAYDSDGASRDSSPVTVNVQEVAPISVPNANAPVGGSLPGSIAVSPTGAATYAVPIAIPPGTAGAVPALALNYNSQSGPGLMGIGWTLGGLSTVSRCAQTVAQDGTRRGIELNANDRYCLDGQRLILISGTNGATAEYRTEVDSFAQIRSFGTDPAKGPDRWEVRTKSGVLMHYGNTADSLVEAQGKSPVVILKWALSKVEDRKGNYWSVAYDENTAEGEHYPRQISYTGNSSAGLLPYAAVRFVYEGPRTDPEVEYVAGSKVSTLRRLSKVQTFVDIAADGAGGSLVRDLRIAYVQSSQSGRSLVQSLQDCDGTGVCLPSTTFDWRQHADSDRHFNGAGSGVWGGPVAIYETFNGWTKKNVWNAIGMVDLNGDGKTDMLKTFETGTWQACLSTGTGFDCQNWSGPALKMRDVILGDFDGDGRTDLLHAGPVGEPVRVCRSNGAGFTCESWPGLASPQSFSGWASGTLVGDHNGDGRDDLGFCYSTGTGFNCMPLTIYNWAGSIVEQNAACPEEQRQRRNVPGDYNGDGRADYLVIETWSAACKPDWATHSYYWELFVTTDDGTTRGWVRAGAAPGLPQVDINTGHVWSGLGSNLGAANQDVYPDVVLGGLTGGVLKACRGKGDGSFACDTPTVDTSQFDGYLHTVADFDGDGRADAFHRNSDTAGRVCQLGVSASLACASWTLPGASTAYGDFNGDGKTDLASYNDTTQQWSIWLAGGARPDLLSQVTNGIGHVTQLTYKPLSDGSVYTRDSGAAYPQRDVQDSTPVVSQVRAANGVGGWFVTDYRYGGMKTDLAGRGSLGFRWLEAADQTTHVTTRTEFAQVFPHTGVVERIIATHAGGVELSRTVNTLDVKAGCSSSGQIPLVSRSEVTTKDLDAAPVSTVTTDAQIDCYGNPTNVVVTTVAGGETYSWTVSNTYDNLPSNNWRIGELRTSTITKTAPGVSAVTRTVSFEYDGVGQVFREIAEPNDGTNLLKLMHEYTSRDAFGNVTARTLYWNDGQPRTRTVETVVFEAKGRFPNTVRNALGHAETRIYSTAHGQMTSLTGPNALTTTWEYDSWGRRTRENRADGTYTTWSYRKCESQCGGAALAVIATPSSGAPSVNYIDPLARDLRLQGWGFNGTERVTEREYDGAGRLWRTARTRYVTENAVWTSRTYDDLGRVIQITGPDGTRTLAYSGLQTTITNEKNQMRTELRNGLGKLRQVADAAGTTGYVYDPFGNLWETTDPKGNRVQIRYDRLGRKTELTDPNLGWWTYAYNPLGELVQQVDPVRRSLGQQATFAYDALGRLQQRTEPDLVATWTYDTCAKGVGKLCEVTATNNYARRLGYDSFGRLASVAVDLDGTYLSGHTYDANGRLASVTHTRAALGQSTGPSQVFSYVYNPLGYLKEIRSGGGATYWRAENRDALDRVTREVLGNGLVTRTGYRADTARLETIVTGPDGADTVQNEAYQYDSLGNLMSRTFLDGAGALLSETFDYDALNRLTFSRVGAQAPKSFSYDELGNLTSKTGVGTYAYPASGAGAVRPHAVASITGVVNGVANPSFGYDANGNLVSGAGRTWSWTAANRPRDITQASQTTSFTYGPERQRIKQTVTQGASTVKTIHYVGAMQKDIAGGSTVVRTYLPLDLGVIVEAGGTSAVRYFHRDRLGSVIALTDEAGAVRERHAYDAWGRRRNADGSDAAGNLTSAIDDTGYTGHEMLDALGLVHMNGRLYDPLTGRMQSADPLVPDPADPQSFNRYAYVHNNPLGYTDPSGFFKVPWARGPLAGSDGEPLNSASAVSRADNVEVDNAGVQRLGRVEITGDASQVRSRREVSGPRPSASGAAVVTMATVATHMRPVGAAIERGAKFLRAVFARPVARGGGLGIGIAAGLELTAGAQRDPITDSLVFNEMNTGNGENDAGALGASEPVPDLPTGLTGQNPRQGSGNRINTDLPGGSQEVFDKLTGGKSTTLEDGTKVGENGVRLRPGKSGEGPRIDIPASGSRPHETIHFPPGG